ncbi:helix-turn-helix transcriptional regulator [Diplocloster hominis]|uniref:helix-turn-helix domain-containing protein n=1 Tax=Diplocloster hominis TaxID=3079010 RepID=UPI0031BA3B03
MEINKDFNLLVGLRIREVREALQMSREQFCEKCDISESFLAAVESGIKSITSKTIYKICSGCNISADYLIFGNHAGYQNDMILELLNSLDDASRESAIRILTEFINAIRRKSSQ